MPIQKTEVQLNVNGRKAAAYLAAPSEGGPGILVLHAWWGLKPFFKQVCDQLAARGFVALAPDLRDGEIAQTIEAAKELMERSDGQFAGEVVEAARNYLLAYPSRKGGRIGAVGFSMGGAWALEEATRAPEKYAAVVAFYGSGEGDFTKMQAKYLGHFCEVDEWESLDWIRSMEADMKSAGVDATYIFYPGVSHWFVEEDRPEYNAATAKLAWDRTYKFFKDNLSA
ncbi:MAG TPA: dienelactone hydrolase family protein [Anaerolineales bacterium]|jgi:carboxymethylenebutenolidase